MTILLKAICKFKAIPENLNVTLCRYTKINHKIVMEKQKSMNSKSNTEQKVQLCSDHNTGLQIIVKIHGNNKQHGTGTKTDTKTNGTD
jgi:hypothetical protein